MKFQSDAECKVWTGVMLARMQQHDVSSAIKCADQVLEAFRLRAVPMLPQKLAVPLLPQKLADAISAELQKLPGMLGTAWHGSCPEDLGNHTAIVRDVIAENCEQLEQSVVQRRIEHALARASIDGSKTQAWELMHWVQRYCEIPLHDRQATIKAMRQSTALKEADALESLPTVLEMVTALSMLDEAARHLLEVIEKGGSGFNYRDELNQAVSAVAELVSQEPSDAPETEG